jgi:hypothetical protein
MISFMFFIPEKGIHFGQIEWRRMEDRVLNFPTRLTFSDRRSADSAGRRQRPMSVRISIISIDHSFSPLGGLAWRTPLMQTQFLIKRWAADATRKVTGISEELTEDR